jgi:hnRNP-L/PTB/hephaestus splicing factor
MESYKLYNDLSNPGMKLSRGSEVDLFTGGTNSNVAHLGGANGTYPFASILPGAAGLGPASHPALSMAQFPGLGTQNMFAPASVFAGNDAKKVKLDGSLGAYHTGGFKPLPSPGSLQPGAATRVVTICNLPEQTNRSELCSIGAVHGKITAASIVEHKNQGFLEFEEERAAMCLVQRAALTPPTLRGQQLYVQFSNSKDMKSMISSSAAAPGVHYLDMSQMNVAPVNAYMNHPPQSPHAGGPDSDMSMRNAMGQMNGQPMQSIGSNGDERTVLRVIVEMGENTNIYNQVNLDVLHHLFSRTGTVLKIITFAKPGYPQQFQALIQYDIPKSAQTAKELFDGQNLYYGCCPLKVEYSKLTNLNVKFNNEKSKDFTRELPSGEGPTPNMSVLNDPNSITALAALAMLPQYQNPLGALGGGQMNPFAPLQASGMNPNQAMPANMLLQQLRGVPGNAQPSNNSVLLVGNLNTEKVTCDGLFTLFGVYGDVQRVKILFNKQDSALIQMAMESQANIAIEHLNETVVYGKEMRVSLSKHQLVQMPKEGQPDAGLTRDYSNSPLHRFRKQGSKNYQNIYPPSCTPRSE